MPRRLDRRTLLTLLGATAADALLTPRLLRAAVDPDWTAPMPSYRIAGNLHYVGSRDLASFLITTPRGHILINSNLPTSPAQIRAGIEKLGFRIEQVKILLISHAHYDHCSGSAQILQESGARYMVLDGDAAVVESGGRKDFQYGKRPEMLYPSAKVDRVLRDGDLVSLGDVTLTAHKTAGHTKGCTTWTLPVIEDGKRLNAVIVGGPNAGAGYNLIDDRQYPQMAADFAQGFQTLASLPCDIFLGAHGGFYDMLGKFAQKRSGNPNAFVDPGGYQAYVADRRQAFEAELARQQKARSRG